jgi:lipoate synthase
MANIGVYRAVGSPAPDTGRYQHSACQSTEIVDKGNIMALCDNRSCPNKGANWVLEEMTATVAVKE